ncbi:MAG: hypothetical protein ACJ75M_09830, partial [Actinomycetes bacterium]
MVHRQPKRRRALMASDPAFQRGQSMQGLALATLILKVLEDRQGAGKHGLALGEADGGMARLGQMAAAAAEEGGFAAAVAGLLAGGQGVLLDRVQR